jgi:predicted protein tyrosine phosphatase
MKLSFTVIGLSTLSNGLICVNLKNNSIPDESKIPKKEVNLFDVGSVMEQTMQVAVQQQQKAMFGDLNVSRLILTPDEFEEMRLTVKDLVSLEVKKDQ